VEIRDIKGIVQFQELIPLNFNEKWIPVCCSKYQELFVPFSLYRLKVRNMFKQKYDYKEPWISMMVHLIVS